MTRNKIAPPSLRGAEAAPLRATAGDWANLGQGALLADGIRLGMTPVQAYSAMGESGGERMEHPYSSADKRTLFLGRPHCDGGRQLRCPHFAR